MCDEDRSRRKNYRFLAGIEAELQIGEARHECAAVDLNRQGVMLLGTFDPPEVPDVRVTLRSSGGDLRLELNATVAYAQPGSNEGETRVGMAFAEMSAGEASTLERLVSRVIEGTVPAPIARLQRGASRDEVRAALDTVPEAHRIQLAQRAQIEVREFLIQDESMRVLESLARNPHLTAPELTTLIRMRNLLPTILDTIARDPRWIGREETKIQIATHPRVTLATAERLVNTLSDNGLRKIIRMSGLNSVVKQKILARMTQKQLRGWG